MCCSYSLLFPSPALAALSIISFSSIAAFSSASPNLAASLFFVVIPHRIASSSMA